jgi:hypothetical protein
LVTKANCAVSVAVGSSVHFASRSSSLPPTSTTKSPEVGWVDLDPTNGAISDDEHVTVAWGRDYSDASPLKAVILGGSAHQLSVAVEVARV